MRRSPLTVIGLALLLWACAGGPATTTAAVTTTTPATTTTGDTVPPLVECPPVPYSVHRLPERATGRPTDPGAIELDEYTSIGGTRSDLWVDAADRVVVALVRGTLPPREWPGDKGEVDIAGTRAVVGPFDDGSWVAAWYQGEGERCDRYTMIFYPPVQPSEVELTLASITRND
jgi:hypothetical protein